MDKRGKLLTTSEKWSILDVWQGSEYIYEAILKLDNES